MHLVIIIRKSGVAFLEGFVIDEVGDGAGGGEDAYGDLGCA